MARIQRLEYRARRTHKDSMFRDLFGTEENKANTLSLYNALAGTSYDDPSVIQITTLNNAIYISVKNDVSFLIHDEMVLWEHQSTHNPNMPLRGLEYFTRLYTKWVEEQGFSVYGVVPIKLPRPRYVVFYIGEKDRPEKEVLRLSDLFVRGEGDEPRADDDALEVTVTVYNINEGMNTELASACKSLAEYVRFVALIREGRQNGLDISEAVDEAVERSIDEGTLTDYLMRRRSEVKEMFLETYDEADTMKRIRHTYEVYYRDVGRKEGREEGRKEGREVGLEEGREEGRKEGREVGLEEGREEGRKEGRKEGREVGLEEGRKEGREEGREVGLEEGRKEGREEGREEDRAEFLNRAAQAVSSGGLSLEDAARFFGFSEAEIEALL